MYDRSMLPLASGVLHCQPILVAEDSQVTRPTPEETETATGVRRSLLGRSFVEKMPAIDRPSVWGKLIPWAMKGGLALLDQGLITGSNFVLGIVLARWLPPDQYGAYAVAFAAFLLLLMLYQSLFLEPQAVFGASAYRRCFRGYLKALLRLHLVTALLMLFVLGV